MGALLACLCLGLLSPAAAEASAARRFWQSLLVPGWGQLAAGHKESALRFAAAELALWGGFAGLNYLSDVRRDSYRSYAAEHAGARTAGKSSQYFDDLGFYQSRTQHDRFARYEDGPNAVPYGNSADSFWAWDQDESRRQYRKLRNASQTARRQALFVTGAVVVNHLVAAIHAARRADQGSAGLGLQLREGGFRLVWQKALK